MLCTGKQNKSKRFFFFFFFSSSKGDFTRAKSWVRQRQTLSLISAKNVQKTRPFFHYSFWKNNVQVMLTRMLNVKMHALLTLIVCTTTISSIWWNSHSIYRESWNHWAYGNIKLFDRWQPKERWRKDLAGQKWKSKQVHQTLLPPNEA